MKKLKNVFNKHKKVVLVIAITGLLFISARQSSQNFELTKNLDIFANLYKELFINYVDEITPAELIGSAIDGMLEALDPYTTFIPESEIEDYRFMTTGQYGGIGALIHYRENKAVISEPYKGFPAYNAGIVAGDIILEINNRSTSGLTMDDIRTLLHGQPGSEVELKIKRYGYDEPLKKTLEREIIKVDNIRYYGVIDENAGYIRLSGFTHGASNDFRDAFSELKEKGIESLIIDLRGNGGGLLNEAVNIVNLFVEKDKIVVETKGRIPERNTVHKTQRSPVDTEIPLIVLVDRASASASEIVAGAIQDFDRGVVIGERTFGKGLVQNIVSLAYNTQLKVTIAKYYIPSGRCIQAIDYAKRNEDGSVAEIPDSLKIAHKTKGGRKVYDGGGIEPDIETKAFSPANITIALLSQHFIFDFASRFFHENEEISRPDEFYISDNIYNNFISFIEERSFSYQTSTEKQVEQIIEATKEDEYFYLLEDYILTLKNEVEKTKEKDIFIHAEEIKKLLRSEIVSRYYHASGRIQTSLRDDEDVLKAIKVLEEGEMYSSILTAN